MAVSCDKELLNSHGYKFISKIGQGGFSSVFKVSSNIGKNSKDNEYAIKLIKLKERSILEIKILKSLKHDNIVRYIDHFNNNTHIYLVMEYCNEGDLETFILKRHKLSESLVKVIMQHLALAISYLQLHEICHMDIKPKNILVSSQPRLTFKLSDFGIAEIMTSEYMELCRENGTVAYMAPEKVTGKKYDSRSDLWSLGVVMYQCLFGKPSYFHKSASNMKNMIGRKDFLKIPANSHITSTCEDLLCRLLTVNPDERITFAEFYDHPFIDLSNMPTYENYLAIIKVVNQAVALDAEKDLEGALKKYLAAIDLLQPYLLIESPLQREKMHAKYFQYTKRAAELRDLIHYSHISQSSVAVPTEFSKELLVSLASSTPKLLTGLEIGFVAEQYLLEGKKQLAFTKINEALEVLIPLFASEPFGHRRTLLHAQIDKWLGLAEELKVSLESS